MKKKILVIYFSQTGQLRNVVDAIVKPISAEKDIEITYEKLKPKEAFPFPWQVDRFLDVMPEAVLGVPCEIEPVSVDQDEHFDLILIAYQPWYLSPALPLRAFFSDPAARKLLSGKPVLTVGGSRNMWVRAHKELLGLVEEAGGLPVGNISLCDTAPNMLSAVTIVRWMMTGKRDRFLWVFPPAGISEEELRRASRFAPLIGSALFAGRFDGLRKELVNARAVEVNPELAILEERIKFVFRLWARFIRAKGDPGAPARLGRIRLFKCYLIIMLYLVFPVVNLSLKIVNALRRGAVRKRIAEIQGR
jgi:hypothetical protein